MYLPFAPGNFCSSLRIISVGNGHNDWRENKEMGTWVSYNIKQSYVRNHVMENASLQIRHFLQVSSSQATLIL